MMKASILHAMGFCERPCHTHIGGRALRPYKAVESYAKRNFCSQSFALIDLLGVSCAISCLTSRDKAQSRQWMLIGALPVDMASPRVHNGFVAKPDTLFLLLDPATVPRRQQSEVHPCKSDLSDIE
eukprot:3932117-Amphidinium_carterae.1